jgi:hypothetical protein
MASTKTFSFVAAPPERSMRKKSPESAPRLFEWLVDNGYAEPVTTYNGGRGGRGKKKKKKSPF